MDALIRRPLAKSTQAATIVLGEHVLLVLVFLPVIAVALPALWRAGPRYVAAGVVIGAGSSALATILFTQAFVEGEIMRLEGILSSAQVIETTGKKDIVALGSKVTVVEEGESAKEIYHIVGSAEANPAEGKISSESPLGKALLGAKVGAKVVVNAPAGEITFVIKAIA